jgi:hypothetical protein
VIRFLFGVSVTGKLSVTAKVTASAGDTIVVIVITMLLVNPRWMVHDAATG